MGKGEHGGDTQDPLKDASVQLTFTCRDGGQQVCVGAVALDSHGGAVGPREEGILAAAASARAQRSEGALVGVLPVEVGQVLDVQRQLSKDERRQRTFLSVWTKLRSHTVSQLMPVHVKEKMPTAVHRLALFDLLGLLYFNVTKYSPA